jgi:hypothetical protein
MTRHLQQAFPGTNLNTSVSVSTHQSSAYLTARGGVDKKLLAVMRTLFATRFGPRPFSQLLCEMRHLSHANSELSYLQLYAHAQDEYDLPTPPAFSAFGDRARYAGTHPSVKYCKAIFTEWMRAHLDLFDRVIASLPGTRLASDHTFKVWFISLSLLVTEVKSDHQVSR